MDILLEAFRTSEKIRVICLVIHDPKGNHKVQEIRRDFRTLVMVRRELASILHNRLVAGTGR